MNMNQKYLTIGIFLIVLILFLSGCLEQFTSSNTPPTEVETDNTKEKTTSLHAKVIDKTTGEPIENVLLYLGIEGASGDCYTNEKGEGLIEDFVEGDYRFSAFKKGYDRYTTEDHFAKGYNYRNIELEKKIENHTSFTIEGVIIEDITGKGTKSEDHFCIIRDDSNNTEYIFNELGANHGCEDFIDRRVCLTGFKEAGFIGWQHEEVEGIYVEEIRAISGRICNTSIRT
jgi:hypothetical protein